MRQAIMTKYLGPTNYLPARVRVWCSAKKISVYWNYELNPEENHTYAANTLVELLGWDTELIGGADDKGGYVFVQVN